MPNAWELPHIPKEKRKKIQDNPVRKMMIGAYAPREPAVMEGISSFLKAEKRHPLRLIHRVLDRFASMTINTTVMTYEEIREFVKSIPDGFLIAKGPCACRLHTADELGPDAKDLKAGKLEHCRQSPLNVDIQIGACGEAFGSLDSYEFISKEALLELEEECHNLGLVSNVYMMFGGDAGICHCSSATCVPFIANRAIKGKTAVIRKGRLRAATNKDLCDGKGQCAKVCHFGARRIVDENGAPALKVNLSQCYGCGLCADVCPQGAISMIPRKAGRG